MTTATVISAGNRLGSMVLDHFIMTMIAMLFFAPMFIGSLSQAFSVSHEPMTMSTEGPFLYIALLGVALYFCKDVVNGRSIAKRITKTQVVDYHSGEVATPWKCLVRNISCIIWPVEVIITLANPERRLGDRIAGTAVVPWDPVHVAQPTFRVTKAIVPLAVAWLLVLIISIPLQETMNFFPKASYQASSYNAAESKALETLFSDRMGEQLQASVKIYDSAAVPSQKYISVIYMLKKNYLANDVNARELQQTADQLLYSRYPAATFQGQAQYVYKNGAAMHTSSYFIGTAISEN